MEFCKSILKCAVSVLPGGKYQQKNIIPVFINMLTNKAAHYAKRKDSLCLNGLFILII